MNLFDERRTKRTFAMKRHAAVFLSLALLLGACGAEQADAPAAAAADVIAPYDVYGEAFSDEGALPVQAVVAEREQYLGQSVKVEGTVAEVCQAKGCWLTLQTGDGNNVRIHVARKESGDYAFTVPNDISGRRVIVQGTLAEETLLEGTQRHLAEDAGREVNADSLQPMTELQITAQGVLLAVEGP